MQLFRCFFAKTKPVLYKEATPAENLKSKPSGGNKVTV